MGPVASSTGTTTSMSSSASATCSLSLVPSAVRGRCRPGVSTNTAWTPGRCSTPRTARRVVLGRGEVMVTLVPRMRFTSVDFPTLGRPTTVTKPERSPAPTSSPAEVSGSSGPVVVLAALGTGGTGRVQRGDPDAADAMSLDPLGHEAHAIDLHRLALDRDPAQDVEQEAAHGVPVAFGELGVEELVELVDGKPGRDRHLTVAEGLHGGLLDVVLVDDLAHQFLDEVLEGDQSGGAPVLVDGDRLVKLALLHLAHEPRHPLGLGDEVRGPHEVAHGSRAVAVALGPDE